MAPAPILDFGTDAEEKNTRTVTEFYAEVFGKHRLDALGQYFATDFIQHNPLFGQGVDGYQNALGTFIERFQDLSAELEISIAQNDRVMAFVTWRGHETETGEELAVKVADLFRFEDGKIVERWDLIAYAEFEPFGVTRPDHVQPDTAVQAPGTPAQEANLDVLQHYINDVTIQDTSLAYTVIAEDFVQHDPMITPGLEGFRECCENFHQLCPDMKVTSHHMVVGDRHVGAFWSWNGHKVGTGEEFFLPTADMYSLENNKFTAHWDVLDFSYVKKLLGFHPKEVFEEQQRQRSA